MSGLVDLGRRRQLSLIGLVGCALALVLLSGCGSLLGSSGPPVNLYDLTSPSGASVAVDLPVVSWQLAVEKPLAAGGLGDNRIAVRPTPHQLQYISGARWTESAPAMLQTLLVESLEATERIEAVGRLELGFRADYRLATELRAFEAVYTDPKGIPDVRVRLTARLLQSQRIVATASFEQQTTATGRDLQAIVDAFDRATNAVLAQVVRWTLSSPGDPQADAD